jgi:hypothetical protein
VIRDLGSTGEGLVPEHWGDGRQQARKQFKPAVTRAAGVDPVGDLKSRRKVIAAARASSAQARGGSRDARCGWRRTHAIGVRRGCSASRAPPADVARDFFAAERDGRWLDAAHLLDLKSFEPQREQSITNARRARPEFHLTVEQLLRHNPTMPRAVAEYQVKQSETMMRDFNPLLYEYADVPNADSLAHLPVDVAAARWLEAKDPRWLFPKSDKTGVPAECEKSSGPAESACRSQAVLNAMQCRCSHHRHNRSSRVSAGTNDSGSTDLVSYVLFRDRYEACHTHRIRGHARPGISDSTSALTLIKTLGAPARLSGLISGLTSRLELQFSD